MRNGDSQYVTLAANTVTTVTFSNDDWTVDVINRDATADVFFTVDGSDPVIDGRGTYLVPALSTWPDVSAPEAGPTVVKLISSGSPKVAVFGMRDVGGRR